MKKCIDIFKSITYSIVAGCIVLLSFVVLFQKAFAGTEVSPNSISVPVLAGAEVVMKENNTLLAYKELMRISNLLIVDPVAYMEEYNKIMETYSKYLGKQHTIYEELSEEDITYLQRCVETETFGATDFAAKVNIANVIFNRMRNDEKFAATAKGVVTTPGQFAYSKTQIDPLTVAACEYAYINPDTTMGALYFHSGAKTTTFNGASYLFTDNVGHHFYGIMDRYEE